MVFYDYLKNLSQVRLKYHQGKVLGYQPVSPLLSPVFLPSCLLHCQGLLLTYRTCFLTRTRIFCPVTLGSGISSNFFLSGEEMTNSFSSPVKHSLFIGNIDSFHTSTPCKEPWAPQQQALRGSNCLGKALSRHQQCHPVILIDT